jgi:hypothetical protein
MGEVAAYDRLRARSYRGRIPSSGAAACRAIADVCATRDEKPPRGKKRSLISSRTGAAPRAVPIARPPLAR